MPANEKIKELEKATSDLTSYVKKISEAKTIQEVNDLEHAAASLLPAIQRVVTECAWDLKRAVLDRRAGIAKEIDKDIDKELGL